MTVVPFTHVGDVVLVAAGGRFRAPLGEVQRGEDPLVETTLRIGLSGAAFRQQNTHPLATSTDRRHVIVWSDGARYDGERPHRRDAARRTGPAGAASKLLVDRGDSALARLVDAADQARRTISDDESAADIQRLVQAVYLTETTPQGGSGFHGNAHRWRETHEETCDTIDRDGTFLDVGRANGHLMECVGQFLR